MERRPLPKDELVGTWVANHGEGADTLFVQPGGQYIHKFVFTTGTTYVDTGTGSMMKQTIENYGFMTIGPFGSGLKRRKAWTSGPAPARAGGNVAT
ncbi:MAG: hypothetical protein ACE5FH_07150 [Candidatus Zixiibacteriota bacterium]